MRRIEKGAPPPSLLSYAKQRSPVPTYDDYRGKHELRSSLLRDQRGICCYCMRRIEDDPARTKIEHLHSQARHPNAQLEWKNLFLACVGGQSARPAQQTCDTSKGDADIGIDPAAIREDDFSYTEQGRIQSRNPESQQDLDEVLNLNEATLTRARIAALDELRKRLQQKLGARGAWTRDALGRERDALRAQQPLPELIGVLEYWIVRHQRPR